MINLEALKLLKPALTAGSNEPTDPFQFIQMVTPLFTQAAQGVAYAGKLNGTVLAPYVGLNYEDAARKLQKTVAVSQQVVEANWPTEVWMLSQIMLPLLSFDTNVVAYTSNDGKILGFGASPITDAARQISAPALRLKTKTPR